MFLSEAAKLPIWINKQQFADEGVALDQQVTLKLKGGRLESVLHLILNPVQLTFLPEDDVMVVTTATKAGEKLITRTYPVRDLYQGRTDVDAAPSRRKITGGPAIDFPIESNPPRTAAGAGNAPQEKPAGAGKEAAEKGFTTAPRKRHADLVEAITETIEPDSWEELSGPGSYTYVKETGCLVIRQTWAVHRQIVQLLRDLREAKYIGPGGKAAAPVGEVKK